MDWKEAPFSEEVIGLSGALLRKVTRRRFLSLMGGTALGAAAVSGAGWAYVSRVEPRWFQLERVEMRLPRLASSFDGFKLAQISDIHISNITTGEQLSEVIQTILAQQPDLVMVTGDFVDKESELADPISTLVDVLRGLTAQVPVVGVLGNHDYNVGADKLRQVLDETGITELANAVRVLERGADRLYIAGVDDIVARRARLSQVLRDLPDDGHAAILMAHEPDFADSSAMTGRFDLQVSGHSHGGQVVFPLFGAPVLPSYAFKYPSGLYRVGSMIQYTNRGLGAVPPRVRFNCRPEITVFTLRSGAK